MPPIIGETFDDLRLVTPDGKDVALEDVAPGPVLLVFLRHLA